MDHYRRLGVSRTATYEEIRASYRRLARANHPDTVTAGLTGGGHDMAALNEAWRVLSDPTRRRDYDARTAPPAPPVDDVRFDRDPGDFDAFVEPDYPDLVDTAGTRAWMVLITFTMIAFALLLTALFVYAFIRSGSTTR